MKRMKTFVTKFLSVIALGALVLSSCTKDLEDRVGKVEEGLATVIKDVKVLQDKLAAVEKTITTDVLNKITELTTKITALEANGATDAELAAAKNELNATINAIPKISKVTKPNGNIELTFTTNGETEVIEFVGAAAVTVVADPATNLTTVTVGGKSFTFPTSVVMPSTVTGIVVATDVTGGFSLEQDATFDLVISLNTSDAKQVALTAENLVITNAYSTKASIYEATSNIIISKVEAITGALNEFKITIKAAKVSAEKSYRLGVITGENNVVRAGTEFKTTVKTFSPIASAKITKIDAITPVAYDSNFGSVIVDNNTINLNKTVEFTYFNAANNNITSSTEHFNVYINKIANATSVENAISLAGFAGVAPILAGNTTDIVAFKTKFDALRGNASYPNAPEFATMVADPTSAQGVKLNITLPAYDNNKTGKQYYFISILGQSKYDGLMIRTYGVVEVDMQSNQNFTLAAVDANVLLMKYDVADALGASYANITGVSALVPSKFSCKVFDAENNDVTTEKSKITNLSLSGESRLKYTIDLDPALVDGEYSVIVTNNYATNKNLIIKQKVVVASPVITFEAQAAANGYTADGTFNSKDVNPLSFDYTFDSHIKAIVANNVPCTLHYRVKTIATPAVYLDGVLDENLQSTYSAVNTSITADETEKVASGVLSNQRIAYDKTYAVDAFVVFESGHTKTYPTNLTIKYATGASKITGFLAADETTFTESLSRSLVRDAAGALDLSYAKDATKPFYFSNGGTNIYLQEGDSKSLSKSVNYISKITYSVLPVDYNATNMTITDAAATTPIEQYNFVDFSNSSLNADLTVIGVSSFTAKYNFAKVGAANGTDCTKVLIPFVQPIKVVVTDIWNRITELKINVTINEPVAPI